MTDTIAHNIPTLIDHAWRSPRADETPTDYLRRARATLLHDGTRTTTVWHIARALGLLSPDTPINTPVRFTLTPVVSRAKRRYPGETPRANLRWQTTVQVGADEHSHVGNILKDATQRPIPIPWPDDDQHNIFRETNRPYCVRLEMRPQPGVHADDYRVTPAQSATGEPVQREIGINDAPGTRHPRLVLCASAPAADHDPDEALPDLHLVVHRPSRDEHTTYTERVHGLEDIIQRVVRAATRRHPLYDAPFRVTPERPAEMELAAHHRARGLERPDSTGYLLPEDIRILSERLADPRPFAPQRGVHSIARQQVRTPIDTLRDALRALSQTLLERATHQRESNGAPNLTGHYAPPLDPPRHDPTPAALARALAHYLEEPPAVLSLTDALRDWRSRARVQYLETGATATLSNNQPANPLAHREIASRVVLSAHRLSERPEGFRDEQTHTLPPLSWPFFAPTTITAKAMRRTAIAPSYAAALHPDPFSGTWIPALSLIDTRTEERAVLTLPALLGQPLAFEDAVLVDGVPTDPHRAPRYRIADVSETLCPSLANIPLSRFCEPTRIAMSSHMSSAAIPPTAHTELRQRVIQPVNAAGESITPATPLPVFPATVALIEDPLSHEDGVRIARSTAKRYLFTRPDQITLTRDPQRDPQREYVGGDLALYDDVAADTGLSPQSFAKLDDDGLIRPGVRLEPGDALQLYRVPHPDPDSQSRPFQYLIDPAPAHSRAVVRHVHRDTPPTTEEPDLDENPLSLMLDDDAPDPVAQRSTITVHTVETLPMDTMMKITTLHGTKGLTQVVPDEDMPVIGTRPDGTSVIAEIAFSGSSVVARTAPADLLALRFGHLLHSRCTRLRDLLDTFDAAAPPPPEAAPGASLGQRPDAGRPEARAALTALTDSAPYLDVIHVHPHPETRARNPRTLRAHVDAPARHSAPRWSEATFAKLREVLTEVPSRTCLTYHAGAGPAERHRIETGLDYVTDEELTVEYARAADHGREHARLPSRAAAGVVDMLVLIHHGRKQANTHPLGATHSSPLTGQPVGVPGHNAARIGLLEHDQFRAAAPDFALDALLHSDARTAAEAQKRLERSEEVPLPARRPEATPRIEQSIDALLAAAGWTRHADGAVSPLGDDALLAMSAGPLDTRALDHAFTEHGDPIPDTLHDPARFGGATPQLAHIALHEPIVHPGAFQRPPGRALPLLCALLDLTPRQLRDLARTPSLAGRHNGPAQLRTRLLALQRDIHTAPHKVLEHATHYAPKRPEPFVDAVKQLIAHPQYLPSNFIIEHVPVLPPVLRRPYLAPGATTPTATHDLDRHYTHLLRTNHAAATRTLKLHDTTRAISSAFARIVPLCRSMLGGKHGLFNRALFGFHSPISARASILPADPRTLPSTHIEIARPTALALYAHWAKPLMQETYGLSPADAHKALHRWAHRHHLKPEDAPAHDVMTRVIALGPVVAVRAPALHIHNALALWPTLRDPRNSPTLHPTRDTSLRLHPALCAGPNADFDGDSMTLFAPVTPQGAQSLVEGLTPSRHLIRWGNGRALPTPSQAARAGLLRHLNDPGHSPAQHLLALFGHLPQSQRSIARILARHDDPAWQQPARLTPPALNRLLQDLLTDPATPAAQRTRACDALWSHGFTHAPRNASPTFAAFESLGQVFHTATERALLPEMIDTPVPRRTHSNATHEHDDLFLRQAARHFESACAVVSRWANDPPALGELAARMGAPYPEHAARAQSVLDTIRGGGRLNVAQVVRTAIAAGAPTKLNARPCGTYNDHGLLEGTSAELVPTTALAGGEGKISGDSVIARAGALAHRLNQAVSSLTLVATDCGGPDPENQLLVAPSPVLEGAVLAADLVDEQDRTVLTRGSLLTKEHLELATEKDLLLAVRTINTCQHAPEACCATCIGHPRAHREQPLPIGTDIAQIAAACSNEQISQPVLRRFHAGGMLLSAELGRRTLCDAIVTAIGDGTNEADGELIEFEPTEARDPRPGWLSGLYTAGWLQGEHGLAIHRLAEGLHALYDQGDASDIDPTLTRIIAHGLSNPDPDSLVLPGLDITTARNGPERHAATGHDPHRALSVFASPATAHLSTPLDQAYTLRQLRTRNRVREHELFRAVIHDDLPTLQRIVTEHPETLAATDDIGRNALFEARSPQAVTLLCTAGALDPAQPAPHDPRGLRPIDVMTVRPMPAVESGSLCPAARRARLLHTALAHVPSQTAKVLAKDPHIRATLRPAGPAKRKTIRATRVELDADRTRHVATGAAL